MYSNSELVDALSEVLRLFRVAVGGASPEQLELCRGALAGFDEVLTDAEWLAARRLAA